MSVPEHLTRYLDIHEFKDKFEEFKAIINGFDSWLSKGCLFVVAGDRGYGKTSLRQRCGYWMSEECKKDDCEIVAVDLSDESWDDVDSDVRLKRMRTRIIRIMRGYLGSSEIDRITAVSDMEDWFWELGEVLRTRGLESEGGSKPIVLVVLLPGFPKPAEIERCYGLIRTGMVLLAEMFKPDEIAIVAERSSTRAGSFVRDSVNVYILQLEAMNYDDFRLLREWLQGVVENCPSLTDDAFERWASFMIDRQIGPGTLIKDAIGAIQYAMKESANEVTGDHIWKYYSSERGTGPT